MLGTEESISLGCAGYDLGCSGYSKLLHPARLRSHRRRDTPHGNINEPGYSYSNKTGNRISQIAETGELDGLRPDVRRLAKDIIPTNTPQILAISIILASSMHNKSDDISSVRGAE